MIPTATQKPELLIRPSNDPGEIYRLKELNSAGDMWTMIRVRGDVQATASVDDIAKNYRTLPERVLCDLDLFPLVGKDVRVTLSRGLGAFGGVITEVRGKDVTVLGVNFFFPTELVVGGDRVDFDKIEKIELRRKG